MRYDHCSSDNLIRLAIGVKNAPEKPRWIVIGFQTEKTGDETKNPAIFDHANLTNMYVMLNSTRYPAVDYNLSYSSRGYMVTHLSLG